MSDEYRPYVVRAGDDLTRLAFEHEFDAEEIWNDPKNDELKTKRQSPDLLASGDILWIHKAPKRTLPLQAGQGNQYQATIPEREVSLTLLDAEHQPLANEVYEVTGARPASEEPLSDGSGRVTLIVPVPTREVSLYVPRLNALMRAKIGVLDPLEESCGLLHRLTNLGYLVPNAVGGAEPGALEAALLAFQQDAGLEPTGRLDSATEVELRSRHEQ